MESSISTTASSLRSPPAHLGHIRKRQSTTVSSSPSGMAERRAERLAKRARPPRPASPSRLLRAAPTELQAMIAIEAMPRPGAQFLELAKRSRGWHQRRPPALGGDALPPASNRSQALGLGAAEGLAAPRALHGFRRPHLAAHEWRQRRHDVRCSWKPNSTSRPTQPVPWCPSRPSRAPTPR